MVGNKERNMLTEISDKYCLKIIFLASLYTVMHSTTQLFVELVFIITSDKNWSTFFLFEISSEQ